MALVGDFAGKDLKISWTRNPANANTTAITYDYGVEFYANSVLVHSDRTTDTSYTYYYDDMAQEQAQPSRVIEARVSERSTFLVESADAIATFTNDKPTKPGFTVTAVYGSNVIEIDTTNISDPDLAGFFVYRSTSPQTTLDPLNIIYTGPERNVVDQIISPSTTYYYQVVAFDMFDNDPANYDQFNEVSVTSTADTPEGIPSYKTTSLDFYKVSTNTIGWNAGTAYRAGTLTNQTKVIPAGTYTWTTGAVYLYFDWASGAVLNTTSLATALAPDTILLAKYTGGNNIHNGTDDIIVDGQNIVAGSIGATQVVLGTALITGTAQLANTVIANVNIQDGEITASKTNTTDFFNNGVAMFGGTIQSNNFISGTSGWSANNTGYAEFNNVLVRNSFVEGAASDYSDQSSVSSVTITNENAASDYEIYDIAIFSNFAYDEGIPNNLHFSFDLTSDRDPNLSPPPWQAQDYPFTVDYILQQRTDFGDGNGWSDWGPVEIAGVQGSISGWYYTAGVPYQFPYTQDFYDFGTIELPTIFEFGLARDIEYRLRVYLYQPVGEERTWTFDNFRLRQKRIFN